MGSPAKGVLIIPGARQGCTRQSPPLRPGLRVGVCAKFQVGENIFSYLFFEETSQIVELDEGLLVEW